ESIQQRETQLKEGQVNIQNLAQTQVGENLQRSFNQNKTLRILTNEQHPACRVLDHQDNIYNIFHFFHFELYYVVHAPLPITGEQGESILGGSSSSSSIGQNLDLMVFGRILYPKMIYPENIDRGIHSSWKFGLRLDQTYIIS